MKTHEERLPYKVKYNQHHGKVQGHPQAGYGDATVTIWKIEDT